MILPQLNLVEEIPRDLLKRMIVKFYLYAQVVVLSLFWHQQTVLKQWILNVNAITDLSLEIHKSTNLPIHKFTNVLYWLSFTKNE